MYQTHYTQPLRDVIAAMEAKLQHVSATVKTYEGRGQQRAFTAAEQRRIDDLDVESQGLIREIAKAKAELADLEDRKASGDSLVDPTPSAGRVVPPVQPINGLPSEQRTSRGFTGNPRSFANLFRRQPAQPEFAGFESLGEFALAIASGKQDHRLIQNAGMTEGTGSSGGFLVPSVFANPIMDAALQREIVRPRATVLPFDGGSELIVPAFDFSDGTSNKRAGLTLTWGPEATALTEQVAATRQILMKPKKGTIYVRVSSELAEDVRAFDQMLGQAMVAAVAAGLDFGFINGTGVGQPLGILSAPALVTVAKESGQAASTILLQNLSKMLGRLHPASFNGAIWIVHPTAVAQLYEQVGVVKNVLASENVGGNYGGAISTDGEGRLRVFGKEVIVSEAASALSSAGDVILADLSQYLIALRRDVVIERDSSVYFASDEIAFKLRLRLEGQPIAAAATKLRDGSNTVSPFVALGAR